MTGLTAAGWMIENESSKTGPESFREAATLVGGHGYRVCFSHARLRLL